MRTILFLLLCMILIPCGIRADSYGENLQLEKEKTLVGTFKKLVTCKNMGAYQDGDLYCSLSFRGLNLEFAGVNQKGGGDIYVTSLGANQTLGMRGSRCMSVMFNDKDLKGIIAAEILFRNDGVITHTTNNEKAWNECQ